jgi:hypothetical protein
MSANVGCFLLLFHGSIRKGRYRLDRDHWAYQ